MRQAVYNKLSKASVKAEAGDIQGALDQLASVQKMKKLSGYEKAQLHTAYGFIYFSQDNLPGSLEAYKKVLQQESLPEALRTSTLYTVAQIQFQLENYRDAIDNLTNWIAGSTNPGPEPYILLGQAYYQLEEYAEAIGPVESAIEIARSRDRRIEESWYMLLRLFHYELRNYPEAIGILETLVEEYPRKEYWMQLAAMYNENGDERKQLAAYEIAYAQGYFAREQEIVLLSQLLMQAEVPYRAGVVLARGMDDGLAGGNVDNYRLLSQAWTLAQEDRKAIDALVKAAGLSSDGELDARLAYAYANIAEWENTIGSARTALSRGIDERDQMQILLGMALFELSRHEDAKSAFRVALTSPDTRETASRWVSFIESEQRRIAGIERTLQR